MATLVAFLTVVWSCSNTPSTQHPNPSTSVPRLSHIAIIVLENQGYRDIVANTNFLPLQNRGAVLRQYYGVAHDSLPNYIAMTSGAPPNAATKANCRRFNCPIGGTQIAHQLDAARLSWKAYFGGTANPCLTPTPGASDEFTRGYVTHHNPFAYYPAIGADPSGGTAYCKQHLRPLAELGDDAGAGHLPTFMFVVPDSCDDGHDNPCSDGRPGGLSLALKWAAGEVTTLTRAPGWDDHSLAVVAFDEARNDDASGCCGGQGGGWTAAVLISGLIRPGRRSP